MEKMWSPWRSSYIESFKDKSENDECVFCAASNEDVNDNNSLVIYKGTNCFVMLNLYPYNNGHVMIIPNNHVSNYEDLNSEVRTEIMDVQEKVIKAFKMTMKPQGFNLGTNIGKAAGAGIDSHLHFHIVPRWMGDTNFMPVLGEVKIISQDLLNTKKELADAIAKVE